MRISDWSSDVCSSDLVGNFKGGTGKYNVKEFFGEVLVPLLRDSALGRSLDLNAAVRRTDYSTSGPVTTWKAGLTWDITDDLRSEEHTSELQSLMRISYAVFCLKKKHPK